MLKINQLTD